MENELLSLIPEYIPLGLGVYDKDGYLKYANGTTLKMFGVTMTLTSRQKIKLS